MTKACKQKPSNGSLPTLSSVPSYSASRRPRHWTLVGRQKRLDEASRGAHRRRYGGSWGVPVVPEAPKDQRTPSVVGARDAAVFFLMRVLKSSSEKGVYRDPALGYSSVPPQKAAKSKGLYLRKTLRIKHPREARKTQQMPFRKARKIPVGMSTPQKKKKKTEAASTT